MWNFEGDENTFFFHNIFSARQRRNIISNVMNCKGKICTKDPDIEKAFIDHFNNIYTDTIKDNFFMDNLNWSPNSYASRNLLDIPFNE